MKTQKDFFTRMKFDETLELIKESQNFIQFWIAVFQVKHKIYSFFEQWFDILNKIKFSWYDETHKEKYIKQWIKNYKEYNKICFKTQDTLENNISEDELEKLIKLKDLLVDFYNLPFRYIFEPLLLSWFAEYIDYEKDSKEWKKIKFLFIFWLCESFDEYQLISEFFEKVETFKSKDTLGKLKVWWFWIFTLPFLLFVFSVMLPVWVFASLLVIVGWIVYKVVKNIHQKADYKIKFNFWVNIVAGFSLVAFLGSSVFITQWDAYKSGYENFKDVINAMSSMNTADFFRGMQGEQEDSEKDTFSQRLEYNYMDKNKSFFEEKSSEVEEEIAGHTSAPETVQQEIIHTIQDQTSTQQEDEKEDKQKYYFSWEKSYIQKWYHIWNMLEKIYLTYQKENNLKLTETQKYNVFKETIKNYTNANLKYLRDKSISPYSHQMFWEYIVNYLPSWTKINLEELEKYFVKNIDYFSN